ncbi:MAG TPA: di-trans,poly-cis-decaprenylcistransferase [Pirellulales bacterium]
MQRHCQRQSTRHVAIIMDGNGRWATRRGQPRAMGHAAGGEAVRRVVEVAPDLGIGVLTLYAFSSANWQRPATEVAALMRLFHEYLVNETELCCQKGVRLSLLGRRDRLPPSLRTTIEAAEHLTRHGTLLHLRLAIDYSSRETILAAARRLAFNNRGNYGSEVSVQDFSRILATGPDALQPVPEVDLVIRTGGERRLSDFLLWESAFAELYFTDRMWPDFNAADLTAALADFEKRERRFGGLPAAPDSVAVAIMQDVG